MCNSKKFVLIGDPFFSDTPGYSERIENEKNRKARSEFQNGIDETNKNM